MHARKTGALIRASAVSGAIMAGAGDDTVASVDRYATDAGLAFQIVDDILDVEGAAAELGKTAGKDAAGAKPTYPRAVRRGAVANARRRLRRARAPDARRREADGRVSRCDRGMGRRAEELMRNSPPQRTPRTRRVHP